MTPEQFTQNLRYLPRIMKDFHDQKDLFKAIEDLYANDESFKKLDISFRDGQIYVIDFFLWFMGQHGYKLQRKKVKGCEFYSLANTIKHFKAKRIEAFSQALSSSSEGEQK